MRSSGFEPPRYCYRQPLKLVRLPVPPRPHRGKDFIVAAPEKTGKARESSKRSNRSKLNYGLVGAAGAGCDGAGAEDCGTTGVGVTGAGAGTVFGAGFDTFSKTELPPTVPRPRSTLTTIVSAQTMNMIAHHVVAWERIVAAPRGPNAVWLPAPPNAPARSAALPLCSSTTMISTRQLSTKKGVST